MPCQGLLNWGWAIATLLLGLCVCALLYTPITERNKLSDEKLSPLACFHWCPTPLPTQIRCCCSQGETSSWRLCSRGASHPEWSSPSPAFPRPGQLGATRWQRAEAGATKSNLFCWSAGGRSPAPSSDPYERMPWFGCLWSNPISCPACPSMDILKKTGNTTHSP